MDEPILAADERLRFPSPDAATATIARVFGPKVMPAMTLAAGTMIAVPQKATA